MIDTDETGQKKLTELKKLYEDGSVEFTEWEQAFMCRLRTAPYKWLSDKQKDMIGQLYDTKVLRR